MALLAARPLCGRERGRGNRLIDSEDVPIVVEDINNPAIYDELYVNGGLGNGKFTTNNDGVTIDVLDSKTGEILETVE